MEPPSPELGTLPKVVGDVLEFKQHHNSKFLALFFVKDWMYFSLTALMIALQKACLC